MSGYSSGLVRELLELLVGCIWDRDRALKIAREWLDRALEEAHPEMVRWREEVELNRKMVAHFFVPSEIQVSYVEELEEQVYRCGSCPREDWELFYDMASEEYGRVSENI